ncbi:late cornified envelope protein 3D-like [Prionailurus bengalensis]|uniref:late cornified envelope protein 3D-like n=1 Tax=Prionailurus bengalensis TaxID=37029 RepID=UPI001CA7D056|nr:late cornified envelope protein 3D-like [Prionailurus bengalensis]
MSYGQSQQQCRPPPKCPPRKAQHSPRPQPPPTVLQSPRAAVASSSRGGCCLGHRKRHGSRGCRRHSSDSCDSCGGGLQSGGSGCGHGSGGGC